MKPYKIGNIGAVRNSTKRKVQHFEIRPLSLPKKLKYTPTSTANDDVIEQYYINIGNSPRLPDH